MSVVSTNVQTTTQADGSLSISLRMYDQDGEEVGSLVAQLDNGTDVNAWVANRVTLQNEQLALAEFETIVGGY